jgi:hypothetical protein
MSIIKDINRDILEITLTKRTNPPWRNSVGKRPARAELDSIQTGYSDHLFHLSSQGMLLWLSPDQMILSMTHDYRGWWIRPLRCWKMRIQESK